MDWDRYKTFEGLVRLGSLTAAARALGLSQSTVSRHLAILEERAGAPLIYRERPIRLTERGAALFDAIEAMVEAATRAEAALEDTPRPQGEVTVSTVGELLRWSLASEVRGFAERYPELRLRILTANRILSLAAGEADLSLRMSPPESGLLTARALATVSYGFFLGADLEAGPEVPWLGLTGTLAEIPEQRIANRAFATRPPRALVEDLESLGLLVQSGAGAAILPRGLAQRLPGLREVSPEAIGARLQGPIPERRIWLVVHRSRRELAKVRVVIAWLEELFGAARAR